MKGAWMLRIHKNNILVTACGRKGYCAMGLLILFLIAPSCWAGSKVNHVIKGVSRRDISNGVKREIKEGNSLYNEGKFKEALKKYKGASLSFPDSDVINFDLGAALYKMKDYQKAISHFEKALIAEGKSIEQEASYNIGNCKYKYALSKKDGNLSEAIDLLTQALRRYERAIELDAKDEDAKYNYEVAKKELKKWEEELKKQKSSSPGEAEKQEEKGKQETFRQQMSQGQTKMEEAAEQKSVEAQQESSRQEEIKKQEEESKNSVMREETGEEEGKEIAATGNQQPTEKISQKEALMLLDNYRLEEEPTGLYKEKIPIHNLPEVLKDW